MIFQINTMRFGIFYAILFSWFSSFSQCIISGSISDSLQHLPIVDAMVVELDKDHTTILSFCNSDENGKFRLYCSRKYDSLYIRVSTLGFQAQTKLISSYTQKNDFFLTAVFTQLPTVTIQRKPISQKGDTINYIVSTFSGKQDRSIGDIISKLPGIEIGPTGAIKYNGKPISTYYINGLNLLEGRYAIANQNIPFDIVDRVQVLENHQPIKLLDSLLTNTSPALNIDLKSRGKNKFIGQGEIGIGSSPFISDDKISGLLFTKKIQSITAYKYNNTGTKLINEIAEQATIMQIGQNKDMSDKEDILSVSSLPKPLLPTTRYLFNNNHLFYLTGLKELQNKALIKFNASYLNDFDESSGYNRSIFFFPINSVAITETQKNSLNTNKISGNFIYELNTKGVYVKNLLKAESTIANEIGLITDSGNLYQKLENPFYFVQNNFTALFPIQKKIMTVTSLTTLSSNREQLDITPGSFPELFNNSFNYSRLTQHTFLGKLHSQNNISFLIGKGTTFLQLTGGTDFMFRNFRSFADKSISQVDHMLNDSFKNDLNGHSFRSYLDVTTILKKGKKQLTISFPLEINDINTTNKILNVVTKEQKMFFNPTVNMTLPVGTSFLTELTYTRKNNFDDFSQSANGFILHNYRSISQNDTILPRSLINNFLFAFSYRNSLKALFSNFSISYSTIWKNIIYDQLYNNVYIISKSIAYPNSRNNIRINTNVSKYFVKSRLNISLSFNYGISKSFQFQTNKLVDISSQDLSAKFKVNFDGLSFLSMESNSDIQYFKNKIISITNRANIFSNLQFFQNMKIYFFLRKERILYFNSYLNKVWDNTSNNSHSFFGDLGIKQKIKRIEIELSIKNISDISTYKSVYFSNNLEQVSQTQIRPRSFFLSLYFKF